MSSLLRDHALIDFSLLQRPIPDNLPMSAMMDKSTAMTTAAALHYDLDIPTLVAFLGGTHIGSHRHLPTIMQELRSAGVAPTICHDFERIYAVGCPARCIA